MNLWDALDGIELILLIVGLFTGGAIAESRRRKRAPTSANTSVLLTYYTEGSSMIPITKGKLEDMHYTSMFVSGIPDIADVQTRAALIYRVELPFDSNLHLVAIPNRPEVIQLDPSRGGIMERVELEGNFTKYFNLFCEKGMQTQTRYVLDPKAMVFTMDFCMSHNWEIIGSELYFLQATGDDANDPTDLFDDVSRFVREIQPAVARPLSEHDLHLRTPYGVDRRTSLSCPICHQVMKNTEDYFVCPNDDGILVSGSKLQRLRSGELHIADFSGSGVGERSVALSCPSCASQMITTQFGDRQTFIDSCTSCQYRWLDNGEVVNKH